MFNPKLTIEKIRGIQHVIDIDPKGDDASYSQRPVRRAPRDVSSARAAYLAYQLPQLPPKPGQLSGVYRTLGCRNG